MVDTDIFELKALPLDILPISLNRIIEKISRAFNVPIEIPLAYSLGILSGALGTSIKLQITPNWVEYPFLWFVVVAKVGEGKTPVLKALMEPVYKKQNSSIVVPRTDYQAESDTEISWFLEDFTFECIGPALVANPKGLIICLDEFIALIRMLNEYKMRGADFERLEKLWSCQPLKIDRKGQASIFTPPSSVSIVGGIQPKVLVNLLNRAQLHYAGFFSRFLFTVAEPIKVKFNQEKWDCNEWENLINQFYTLPSATLRPSREALDVFEAHYHFVHEVKEYLPDEKRGHLIKSIAYVLRLASILHLIGYSPNEAISKEIMLKAINLTKYFLGQYEKVFLLSKIESLGFEMKRVLAILVRIAKGKKRIYYKEIVKAYNEKLPRSQHITEQDLGYIIKPHFKNSTSIRRDSRGTYLYPTNEIKSLIKLFIVFTSNQKYRLDESFSDEHPLHKCSHGIEKASNDKGFIGEHLEDSLSRENGLII